MAASTSLTASDGDGPRVVNQGLTTLYEGDEPVVDIVFVHGFTGHPRSTWTLPHNKPHSGLNSGSGDGSHPEVIRQSSSKLLKLFSTGKPKFGQTQQLTSADAGRANRSDTESRNGLGGVYWPYHLLKETVPNSRILTYGYDTQVRHRVAGPISNNTVGDHGMDLLRKVVDARRSLGTRSLVFVSHSLGGLLVKAALMWARDGERYRPDDYQILTHTKAALFFGTPHAGTDPRGLIHNVLISAAKAAGFNYNRRIEETLLPGNDYLRLLRLSFNEMARSNEWLVYCFQEEYGLSLLGGRKVVDDGSSCLDDLQGETHCHISRNHMDICRFSGQDDPEYGTVAAAFEKILESLRLDDKTTHVRLDLQPSIRLAPSEEVSAAVQISTPDGSEMVERHTTRSEATLHLGMQRLATDDNEEQRSGVAAEFDLLVKMLEFDEIEDRLTNLRKAHAQTCHWFLQMQMYIDWLDPKKLPQHHGFLWIKGKPGAGKSILMKFLLSNARKTMESSDTLVMSFFFNARGGELEKTSLGLYRALLLDLFQQSPHLKNVLGYMSGMTRFSISRRGWGLELLKETMTNAISLLRHRRLFIFIDALDECDEVQMRDMIAFFKELGKDFSKSRINLHICFSSRHYPTIQITKGLEVVLEEEDSHTADISAFIESNLEVGDEPEITREIVSKSAGIFLWVALVVPILNREYAAGRIHAVRRRLSEIPKQLDELFRIILKRDECDLQELQHSALWVLFSVLPLKIPEYYFAVALSSEDHFGEWYEERVSLNDMTRFVSSSSKGLVESTKTSSPTVQFIHESVRDFLLDRGMAMLWPDVKIDFPGHSHEVLKQSCFRYFVKFARSAKAISASPQPQSSTWRFARYATMHVLEHANIACQYDVPQHTFLDSFPLELWYQAIESFLPWVLRSSPFLEKLRSSTFLEELVWRNCTFLLRETVRRLTPAHLPELSNLVESQARFNQVPPVIGTKPGRYGYLPDALFLLITFDDATALRELLGNEQLFPGGSRNLTLRRYLNEAVMMGNPKLALELANSEDVVEVLVDYGADPVSDHLRKSSWTPLSIVSSVSFTTRMLDLGIHPDAPVTDTDPPVTDTDAPMGDKKLPLLFLSTNHAIVEVLLQRGANPNARDDEGQTPLFHQQSRPQTVEITQQLLAHGADSNARDKFGRTPLFYIQTVGSGRCLLLNDAELNARDRDDRTALFFAVLRASELFRIPFSRRVRFGEPPTELASEALRIIQFLASAGTDLSTIDTSGDNVMIVATKLGVPEVLDALLSIQSNPSLSKAVRTARHDAGTCGTAKTNLLNVASTQGEKAPDFIKMLLRSDLIDPNEELADDGPPLSEAVRRWARPLAIREFLVCPRVAVNAQSSTTGSTAFHEVVQTERGISARIDGYVASLVAEFLASDRVDVNARDFSGRTPLHYCALHFRELLRVINALIASPRVKVDVRDYDGATALHLAVINARLNMVRRLASLRDSVAINVADGRKRTPAHLAALHGSPFAEKLLDALLSNPNAHVNATDIDGRTALHIAAMRGCIAFVDRLSSEPRADANVRDKFGCTPLHYAAERSDLVTEALVQWTRVDLHVRDNDGYTPLHRAILSDRQFVVKLLCSSGRVDVDLEDRIGRTPLKLAKKMSLIQIVHELERYMERVANQTHSVCLLSWRNAGLGSAM